MAEFRVGDIVELISGRANMSARLGVRALVTGLPLSGSPFLQVTWDSNDPRTNGQNDGGYPPEYFRIVQPISTEPGGQMSIRFLEENAPQELVDMVLTWCPEVTELIDGVIIAGGFIRAFYAHEEPADLDLYFRSPEDFQDMHDLLIEGEWKQVFETENAISYQKDNKKTQAIKYYFGNPVRIIEEFDYTVCQAALVLEEVDDKIVGKLTRRDVFLQHIEQKKLVYTAGSPLPLSSFKRALKYSRYGYHMYDDSIALLAQTIQQRVDPNTIRTAARQGIASGSSN